MTFAGWKTDADVFGAAGMYCHGFSDTFVPVVDGRQMDRVTHFISDM